MNRVSEITRRQFISSSAISSSAILGMGISQDMERTGNDGKTDNEDRWDYYWNPMDSLISSSAISNSAILGMGSSRHTERTDNDGKTDSSRPEGDNWDCYWTSLDPLSSPDCREVRCDGGMPEDSDHDFRPDENDNDEIFGQIKDVREMLNFLTQDTRFLIIVNILSHPEQAPSLKELDHHIEGKSQSTINNHIQRLVEKGVVEKIEIPRGDRHRSRDLPHKFYRLTEDGYEFIQRHGVVPVNEDDLQRRYMTVDKPSEIRRYEDAPRPVDMSERPPAPDAFSELINEIEEGELSLGSSTEEPKPDDGPDERSISFRDIPHLLTSVANEIENRTTSEEESDNR